MKTREEIKALFKKDMERAQSIVDRIGAVSSLGIAAAESGSIVPENQPRQNVWDEHHLIEGVFQDIFALSVQLWPLISENSWILECYEKTATLAEPSEPMEVSA